MILGCNSKSHNYNKAKNTENEMEKIIVSKYPAVVTFLIDSEIVPGYTKVYPYISPEFAEGKHIFGVVPVSIAAKAALYTEVKVTLHRSDNGKEISLEKLKSRVQAIKTYKIEEIL